MSTSGAWRSPTLEGIERIVRDLLGDESIVLAADTRPADVEGWDSLANVSIVFAVEEDFGVAIGDETLAACTTVGALAAAVDGA
jgi:acyl carrier protein